MSADKDGGSAFPRATQWTPDGEKHHSGNDGMSLRDYFAGRALAGIMAGHRPGQGQTGWQSHAAWDAYSMADTMLAQRAKTGDA